jgi:hypothetical protein
MIKSIHNRKITITTQKTRKNKKIFHYRPIKYKINFFLYRMIILNPKIFEQKIEVKDGNTSIAEVKKLYINQLINTSYSNKRLKEHFQVKTNVELGKLLYKGIRLYIKLQIGFKDHVWLYNDDEKIKNYIPTILSDIPSIPRDNEILHKIQSMDEININIIVDYNWLEPDYVKFPSPCQ